MQSNYENLRARINELLPDRLKLDFGCEVRKIFWYKSEKDKKDGKIDWLETGHHIKGRQGVCVKDLRSDFLMMWIDYGYQLEFQIGLSMEILGKPLTIADVLRATEHEWATMYSAGGGLIDGRQSEPRPREGVVLYRIVRWFDLTKPLSAPENDEACRNVLELLNV